MLARTRLLTFVFVPTLALGAGCAHKGPPPVRAPQAAPTLNAPVTFTLSHAPVACTGAECDAYQHLLAVLSKTEIRFDYDNALLHPVEAAKLVRVADAMKRAPAAVVRISGNCDERGTEEYNLALGQERADAAKAYLVQLGIPAGRVTTVSYGKDHPVDLGHSETAWAKNRRDDLRPVSSQ
jgi:peptidoglycan-associated lipoprotein